MNIYVGNLSFDVEENDLHAAFSNFGIVSSVAIIKDKFSGESRGFGFVEMAQTAEAQKAIAGLNGQPLKGRTLTVNEAKPREERGSSNRPNDRRGGGGGRRNW